MFNLFDLLLSLLNGGVSTTGAFDKFCEDVGHCYL